MRIATWNVNGLRARLDFLFHWLRSRQPDLIGLQELKLTDESLPYAEFQSAGYHCLAHTQKAWNGVAILSRNPAALRQVGLPGQEDQGARLITATCGEITFTTVYCPNGKDVGHPDFPRKLEWLDALVDHLEAKCSPTESLILCGDLNLCPTPLDTWSEEKLHGQIFHTEEERLRFDQLRKWGLFDLYRERRPEDRQFSWWDYRAGAFHKNQGLRIDFLLATRPVLERVTHIEIDREYRKKKEDLTPSDHAPVMADLK
ncbi:MAG: exodeoxyribonuclease III [Acidobacteriota bacterium]